MAGNVQIPISDPNGQFQQYSNGNFFSGQDSQILTLLITATDSSPSPGGNPITTLTTDTNGTNARIQQISGSFTEFTIVDFQGGANFLVSTEKLAHVLGWRVADQDGAPIG